MVAVRITAHPTHFIERGSGRRGLLIIVEGGYPYPIRVTANGAVFKAHGALTPYLLEVREGEGVSIRAETGDGVDLRPRFPEPRRLRVALAPTVHTDWGYTDTQDNVRRLHMENTRRAAAAARRGVKWVVEVIEQTSETLGELLELNREGLVGIQALPLNMLFGLANHEEFVRTLYPARDLRRRGFTISVAALNDVPTAPWALASLLAASGIPYYIQATNHDRAPLHQLNEELGGPTWWIGPDGSRIFAWFSGGYRGTIPFFHGYHQGFSAGFVEDLKAAESRLALYLHFLLERGYPYDDILLYGVFPDNSPYSDKFAGIVEEFRAKWRNPELRLATTDEFLSEFAERYGGKVSAVKGSMGAYWEDGAASSARELALSRRAKTLLALAEARHAWAYIRGSQYPSVELAEAWRNILFWDEHTWGDAASITEPFSERRRAQWAVKAGYARRAYEAAKALAGDGYAANPYPHRVSGLVNYTHYDLLPFSSARLRGGRYREVEMTGRHAESPFYVLEVGDGVEAVYEKDSGSLVAGSELFALGEGVYVQGGRGTTAERLYRGPLWNLVETKPVFKIYRERREGPRLVEGDDFVGVVYRGRVGPVALRREILLNKRKREIVVRIWADKPAVYDKEALYFAFPLAGEGRFLLEEPGAFIEAGKEHLRGACTEWFSVVNTVISRGRVDVALYSADAPLFTIGDIFRGEWSGGLKPGGGLVFSYVMNNYWHTNYKAAQGGEFFFEYMITSDADLKPSRALALLTPPVEGGYIEGDLSISPEAAATAFKKWDLGEGVVLRLLEVDGERKSIILKSTALAGLRLYSANPLEEPVEELGTFSGEAEVELQPRRYTTLIFAR